MIPELIDSNTYLLRDYTSLIQNLTDKMSTLTTKWTDFTISEPDTIFLSNIAYLNDLTSYIIDYRYLLTSVKYTSSRDFINSICILTGSSAPFYRETYSITIEVLDGKPTFIPKNTVLYDSARRYALTTLEDVYILPYSRSVVSVIEGNAYTNSLGKTRAARIKSRETVNLETLFDHETGSLLSGNFSSAEAIFKFLVSGEELFWTSQGDNSALVFSPSLPYAPYKFVGFSIEKENVLADTAKIVYPGFNGNIQLNKKSEGSKPRSLNDNKIAYLESLKVIQTDANSSLFEERYKRGSYKDISRVTLSFDNRRSTLLSSSYVSYTEGYIDLSGIFHSGDRISVAYDYYYNAIGPSKLHHKNVGYVFTDELTYSTTINLELESGCTVKAFSLFVVFSLSDESNIYCTDYDNKLIMPRGTEVSKDYKYILTDRRSCTDLDFAFGECYTNIVELHVSDNIPASGRISTSEGDSKIIHLRDEYSINEKCRVYDETGTLYETPQMSSGSYYRTPISLIIPVQSPMTVQIQGKRYHLKPYDFTPIYLYGVNKNQELKIRTATGNPLFKVAFSKTKQPSDPDFITLDEEAIQNLDEIPSCVYHDENGIYVIPTNLLGVDTPISVTLDGICTYQYTLSSANKVMRKGVSKNLYRLPYNQDYIQEFYSEEGYPSVVCITVGDRQYYSERRSNTSNRNHYNSIVSSDLAQHSIDLYQISSKYSQVSEVPIDVTAKVYLKPLDLDTKFIEDNIMESLRDYFDSLEISEDIKTASILSKIVHASEYVAYAELQTPLYDREITDLQLAVLGNVRLTFRNPDIIQY